MVKKLYLFGGIIFEAVVVWGYTKEKPPYRVSDYIIGGIIDVLAWPIVLLDNIREWSR